MHDKIQRCEEERNLNCLLGKLTRILVDFNIIGINDIIFNIIKAIIAKDRRYIDSDPIYSYNLHLKQQLSLIQSQTNELDLNLMLTALRFLNEIFIYSNTFIQESFSVEDGGFSYFEFFKSFFIQTGRNTDSIDILLLKNIRRDIMIFFSNVSNEQSSLIDYEAIICMCMEIFLNDEYDELQCALQFIVDFIEKIPIQYDSISNESFLQILIDLLQKEKLIESYHLILKIMNFIVHQCPDISSMCEENLIFNIAKKYHHFDSNDEITIQSIKIMATLLYSDKFSILNIDMNDCFGFFSSIICDDQAELKFEVAYFVIIMVIKVCDQFIEFDIFRNLIYESYLILGTNLNEYVDVVLISIKVLIESSFTESIGPDIIESFLQYLQCVVESDYHDKQLVFLLQENVSSINFR